MMKPWRGEVMHWASKACVCKPQAQGRCVFKWSEKMATTMSESWIAVEMDDQMT